MFQFFKESNKYLYHYTTVETAISYIIKSQTIKIGRYIKTNDPKEAKNWQFFIGTNENRDLGSYNMEELSKKVTYELKNKTNVVCFSKDNAELSGNHMEDIFKRGFCKPRMWAQYGGNHTGVCLIFNKQKLNNEINSQFLSGYHIFSGSVVYKNRIIVEDISKSAYGVNIDYLERMEIKDYIKAHIYKHYGRLFFEKALDWRDENEFRWVIFGDKEEDLYLEYNDSLEGIVFGADTLEKNISMIVSTTKGTQVHFEQLVWKNCTPWFSFRLKWV